MLYFLFRIEANRRILHEKRIQMEVNIPFEANNLKNNRILIESYDLRKDFLNN
jgi:hypothetical protein